MQIEREKVKGLHYNEKTFDQFPLIIDGIRKVYDNGKIANRAMAIAVEKSIVFGLLGINLINSRPKWSWKVYSN